MATAVAVCLLVLGLHPPAATLPPVGAPESSPPPVAAQSDWFDCGSDADCADGEFCRFPQGECGGDGTCTMRPEVCDIEYRPVCGCDGQTYTNRCDAASEGMSVDYPGEC
jgi:hypothetical protein